MKSIVKIATGNELDQMLILDESGALFEVFTGDINYYYCQ
jgi:hypothetical protein